jgi:hypothetical protein
MASSAERFHIVLSPDERQAWNQGAARLGVPTAEYVRRAVASFEAGLTADELERLASLADEVDAAAGRMTAMIGKAIEAVDRPMDEAGMQARVAERLRGDPVQLDPARLDFRPSVPAARA